MTTQLGTDGIPRSSSGELEPVQLTHSDLRFFLSGGSANVDPNASLGGAISNTPVVSGLHNLFNVVDAPEATSGSTTYRCIYIKNNNATYSISNATFQIISDSTSGDTSMEIALGSASIGATEPALSPLLETTVPDVGIVFTTSDLIVTNLGPKEYKAVWIKNIINANAGAIVEDTTRFRFSGTPPVYPE